MSKQLELKVNRKEFHDSIVSEEHEYITDVLKAMRWVLSIGGKVSLDDPSAVGGGRIFLDQKQMNQWVSDPLNNETYLKSSAAVLNALNSEMSDVPMTRGASSNIELTKDSVQPT